MRFRARFSTEDGRLTEGKVYIGQLVGYAKNLRIAVYDNKGQWMTFNTLAFAPADKVE